MFTCSSYLKNHTHPSANPMNKFLSTLINTAMAVLITAFYCLSFASADPTAQAEDAYPLGDRLTAIQRPIHSIPELTFPDDTFDIHVSAPESTTDFQASLRYGDYHVDLPIVAAAYDPASQWHVLTVKTPAPRLYELFDLVLRADGMEPDTAVNAVKVEPAQDNTWYFVHITDTHLTTHQYSSNSGYVNDMTEVDDFIAVIDDINIINPKFVLLTGDVINEGELEDYLTARYFSITKNTMQRLEVPIYLVSGNHDVGGWNATPPPAGTARNNWYDFFGWDILKHPNGIYPYRTQNYSFTYNGIKFIGMESYVNYENYELSVFGRDSFTAPQMKWLNAEVSTGEGTKVLFYHYDFSNQINLYSLGVDGALWGHIHRNSGSISSSPFNLATAPVCDGRRTYRIIKVQNGQILPQSTCSAGYSGQNLTLSFTGENNGSSYEGTAVIQNNQPVSLDHCLVKFNMPEDATDFKPTQGQVTQVVEGPKGKTVYVEMGVSAYSSKDLTLSSVQGPPPVSVPAAGPIGFILALSAMGWMALRRLQTAK